VRIARFSVGDQIAFGVVSSGGEGSEDGGPYVTAIDGHPFAPFELVEVRVEGVGRLRNRVAA
jgi:hypothetical protein